MHYYAFNQVAERDASFDRLRIRLERGDQPSNLRTVSVTEFRVIEADDILPPPPSSRKRSSTFSRSTSHSSIRLSNSSGFRRLFAMAYDRRSISVVNTRRRRSSLAFSLPLFRSFCAPPSRHTSPLQWFWAKAILLDFIAGILEQNVHVEAAGVLAGAPLMRARACRARCTVTRGLSDLHVAIADAAPEHTGKRVLIVARDHGATPRLASRSEYRYGARATNLLRSIPEHLRNDP